MIQSKKNVFQDWLNNLFAAWKLKDFNEIKAIFSSCSLYMEDPFYPLAGNVSEIMPLWQEIENQRNINLRGEVLTFDDTSVVYRWQATFESNGKMFDLDGVYFARFGEASECLEFRQWTVEKE